MLKNTQHDTIVYLIHIQIEFIGMEYARVEPWNTLYFIEK